MKIANNINGWIVIDKPSGMNSTKAVSITKKLTKAKKVGHAGTLDPMASGILPVALGEATKAVQLLMNAKKTYIFTITFGSATDTDDADGKIIATTEKIPYKEKIISALPSFIGEIEQVPPTYSAIKLQGKRSYDLARKGKSPELKARTVIIYDLKLINSQSNNLYTFEMNCGKGTYVRSVARDLARKLDSLGHVSMLRRGKVGPFSEKNAISLEKLENMVHIMPPPADEKIIETGVVLPVEAALDDIPVLQVSDFSAYRLKTGRSVLIEDMGTNKDGTIYVLNKNKIVAIARLEKNFVKPVRVFNH